MLNKITFLLGISIGALTPCQGQQVKHVGAMSNIQQERRTDASVLVDTLPQQHLYAVGPVENLRGEIFVWDGKPFVAGVLQENKKPFVLKNVRPLKAIFLVYAHVATWDTLKLNEAPQTMKELEQIISVEAARTGRDTSSAFPFLLYGKIKAGKGHIMYKDTAEKILTPAVQKAANHGYEFAHVKSQFIGFYSQQHQGIFTHKDSYLHIHYRLNTKYEAGHLDAIAFDEKEPLYLYLPKN